MKAPETPIMNCVHLCPGRSGLGWRNEELCETGDRDRGGP